ncbi:MAG: hypothetical protein JO116_25100 [Planctomycetaceae bacterium]|nr:hypothetical protein [Planctomycetaceae bacterium]
MQDLIKLLPDGASVIAVIVVIVLFLKQHDKITLLISSLAKQFDDHIYDSQKTFQEQILKLANQQHENQKAYQNQIQLLIEAHVNVSKETILALKSLEMSLKEAKERGQIK